MGPLNKKKRKKVVVENGCSDGGQRHRLRGCCFVDLMWCSWTLCAPHLLCACLCRYRSTMKDGIANNSTASISQARKAVEQLKMEACMDRIKVQLFLFIYLFLPVSASECVFILTNIWIYKSPAWRDTLNTPIRYKQNCWKLFYRF